MNKSGRVKATRQRQTHAQQRSNKAGRPIKGTNFVTARPESSKKQTARATAARKSAKSGASKGQAPKR